MDCIAIFLHTPKEKEGEGTLAIRKSNLLAAFTLNANNYPRVVPPRRPGVFSIYASQLPQRFSPTAEPLGHESTTKGAAHLGQERENQYGNPVRGPFSKIWHLFRPCSSHGFAGVLNRLRESDFIGLLSTREILRLSGAL